MNTKTRERPAMSLPTMPTEEVKALSKRVAKQVGGSNVAAYFEAQKASLQRLLPAQMPADRFLRITLNALRTTPGLMECTLESLFGATIFCAQMGLEPNTPQGHIYLIPFKNTRKQRTEVQVIVGYQGLITLARRTGEIASISAQAVYRNDDYDIDYLNPEQSRHKPKLNGPRGEFIGAWAKATFRDGGMAFDFMPREDIDRIRDGSQGYRTAVRYNNDRSPWITNYDQMAVKTAIRRLAKRLPMSIEMAAAVDLDERGERHQSQRFDKLLDSAEFDLTSINSMDEDEDAGEGESGGEEEGGDPPPQEPAPARAGRKARPPEADGAEGSDAIARDDGEQGAAEPSNDRASEHRDDPLPQPHQDKPQSKAKPPAGGAGLSFD